ncbi:response regulator, partial [Mycobacterium tuberculosis]|nr:response regulator [Mycobacterium tuberculosis]
AVEVVLDLVMPDLDGMSVLTRLRALGNAVPVVVQTSQGGVDVAVSAMRAGASDFIVKPVSPERLQVSVRNALKVAELEVEVDRSRRRATGERPAGGCKDRLGGATGGQGSRDSIQENL